MITDLLKWLTSSAEDLLSGFSQDTRPIRVRIGRGGGQGADRSGLASSLADALDTPLFVHQFHVQERVCAGEPLRMRLLCVSTRNDLSPRGLLGQPIQVQLVTDLGSLRTFNAVVVRAQPGQFDGSMQTWLVEAVDAMTCMRSGRKTRIFRDKGVLEITQLVLREWQQKSSVLGSCFDYSLANVDAGRYPARSMTQQWNESDSAFLERLWRKSGLGWGIGSGSTDTSLGAAPAMVHTLVLFDDAGGLPANRAGELRYHLDDMAQERNAITLWSPAAQLVPGAVERRSWDYDVQRMSESITPTLLDFGDAGNDLAKVLLDAQVDAPHWADDGDNYTRLSRGRMAHHEMRAAMVQGASGARDLAPLTWATIQDRPGVSLGDTLPNGGVDDYLFLDVEHWGQNSLPKDLSSWVDNLFTANGWRMQMPDIGPHHENRRYANTFTAVERWTPVVPDFDRARDWPNLQPITAKVVCPQGEEVHCDDQGRVFVQFQGLRMEDHEHAGGAGTSGLPKDSAPIRVAQPMASSGHGLMWTPRKGDEVVVTFLGGDPDKPLITGAVYSPYRKAPASFHGINDLPGNRYLTGSRAREVSGQQATHVQHDSTPGQTSLQLHADQTGSQINMGYMTTPRVKGVGTLRGEGLEIRTDGHGAIRAADGLLISTEARPDAEGRMTELPEAAFRLASALDSNKGLSALARQAGAQDTGDQDAVAFTLKEHNDSIQSANPLSEGGRVSELHAPHIVLGSAAGVHASAHTTTHIASGEHSVLTAGQHISLNAGRSLLGSFKESVRLFAYKFGIRLVAASGDIEIQALKNSINLLAKLQITATADKISLHAKTELEIIGGGSYTSWKAGGIVSGTTGEFSVHAASHAYEGPDCAPAPCIATPMVTIEQSSDHLYLQAFDVTALADYLRIGRLLSGQPYRIYSSDHEVIQEGTLPISGEIKTDIVRTDRPVKVRCEVGEGEWELEEDGYDYHEADDASNPGGKE